MYDRANGTLEGLSAPYGMIGGVAPQGLQDLGCTEDTGPVGVMAGEIEEPVHIVDDTPDAAYISAEPAPAHADGRPGSSAMPDPPHGRLPAPPVPVAELPGERPENFPE